MDWNPIDARKGLVSLIDFANGFNSFVDQEAGFKPFDKLQGFKGKGEPLTKGTTRWIFVVWAFWKRTNIVRKIVTGLYGYISKFFEISLRNPRPTGTYLNVTSTL